MIGNASASTRRCQCEAGRAGGALEALAAPSRSCIDTQPLLFGDVAALGAAGSRLAAMAPFDLVLCSDCVFRTELHEPLARTLRELQERGIWVIGTDDGTEKTLYDVDFKGPVALVMGAEGEGMRRLTRETCDELVSIPMAGGVESLNVSVASGVCLYEAVRQRRLKR